MLLCQRVLRCRKYSSLRLGRVVWQTFRVGDLPQCDGKIMLQLQDIADVKDVVADALAFGFSVSFVSAPTQTRVRIQGSRLALQSYAEDANKRYATPVTWAHDGTLVVQ